MNWKSTSDGIMKWKKGAERKLQGFGSKIRDVLTDKRTPEQKLKGGMKAYYEGGGGGRKPKLEDYQ